MHGAAGNNTTDLVRPVVTRIGPQAPEEDLHQVLEGLTLGEDERALEEGARSKSFD